MEVHVPSQHLKHRQEELSKTKLGEGQGCRSAWPSLAPHTADDIAVYKELCSAEAVPADALVGI